MSEPNTTIRERHIRRAVELARLEREPDISHRCRSFVAYLAGGISDDNPTLAAEVAAVLKIKETCHV